MAGHRYYSPVAEVWTDQAKIDRWVAIEIAVAEVTGVAPGLVAEMRRTPPPLVVEVEMAELLTRHDFTAFLSAWRARMSPAAAAAVHAGLTSSDVVDTALAQALADSGTHIQAEMATLLLELAKHANRHRGTVKIGRTHGQWAEPTTWGAEVAGYVFAGCNAQTMLRSAVDNCRRVKLSGPVGTYAHIGPEIELELAYRRGCKPALGSTQAWSRGAVAEWAHALAQVATWVESVALQIRLGAQSDVGELAEAFGAQQTGSSAMPHKRNPVRSERLCGLARVVRGHAATCLENVALWGQRDISHSSVERLVLPELAVITNYMLTELGDIIDGLRVDAEEMKANLDRAGIEVYSSIAYLRLREKGTSEHEAYALSRNPKVIAKVVPDRKPALFLSNLDFVFSRMWKVLP